MNAASVSQLNNFQNVEIVRMTESGNWSSMFWRFLPCSDPEVDIMISRDCDSRLSTRESLAVKEWIVSDKMFHIMRDHPYHTERIMGGMWGAKKGILADMSQKIYNYRKGDYWQIDQEFLLTEIYPLVLNSCMIHDEVFMTHPFPTKRKNYEFVGDVFTADDNRDEIFWKILKIHLSSKTIKEKMVISFRRLLKRIKL